jgi:hypothetical protein
LSGNSVHSNFAAGLPGSDEFRLSIQSASTDPILASMTTRPSDLIAQTVANLQSTIHDGIKLYIPNNAMLKITFGTLSNLVIGRSCYCSVNLKTWNPTS